MRGVRGRLLVTIVGLVALTSVVLGAGAYFYVATSLRGQQQQQAVAQADFNVGVLADQVLPANATKQDVVDTGLIEAFELRGGVGTIVDFGDGDPLTSGFVAANALARLSLDLRSLVDRGEIGFERLDLDGKRNHFSFFPGAISKFNRQSYLAYCGLVALAGTRDRLRRQMQDLLQLISHALVRPGSLRSRAGWRSGGSAHFATSRRRSDWCRRRAHCP